MRNNDLHILVNKDKSCALTMFRISTSFVSHFSKSFEIQELSWTKTTSKM